MSAPAPEEAATEAAAAPHAPRGRSRPKRGTRKISVDTRAPADPADAEPAVGIKPYSPLAEVVSSKEAVIIRFPPVAPPPFLVAAPAPLPPAAVIAPPEPAAPVAAPPEIEPDLEVPAPVDVEVEELSAPVAEDPVVDLVEPVAAEDVPDEVPPPGATVEGPPEGGGRKRRRRGRRRRGKAGAPEPEAATVQAPAPPPPPRPATPIDPEAHLSPSQRRRLRRKRRTERARAAAGQGSGERAPRPAPPLEHDDRDDEQPQITALPDEDETADVSEPVESLVDEPVDVEVVTPRRGRGRTGEPARRSLAEFDVEEDEEPPRPAQGATKEMIINVFPREECRIAVLHKGKLEEIYIERASSENHVGNIYKGVVTNVEPSIQAAFVDFGLGKNGFLHISDLHPQYFPDGGQPAENVGCKIPRRNRPPIQRCLRRGQQVIVQITKEGIGTKGPTLSTYLSIPGRFLVMMPGMRRLGVSRKIEDDDSRHKLRDQLSELELPDGVGFIARTAAQGRTKRELQSDLKYLARLWRSVDKRVQSERAPAELYRESDLVIRTIRDMYTPEIGRIIIDDPAVAKRAREFLHIFSPRAGDVVIEYADSAPVFHKYGVEAELERLHSRHVPLKSGGSLVIDQTEALVAIDVNSGRFRTEDDAESTAFKINMEAADEIARQLRLRDLGGVIICDFIDMRVESHKREIERRLAANLKEHKERARILRMSGFGIIEMTRQRQRASLTRSVFQDCAQCRGTGLVRTAESVTLDVLRTLQVNVVRDNVYLIEVTVSAEVALLLLNRKRALLHELEAEHRRTITIRPNPQFGLDQVEIRCWDQRGRAVPQI